MSMLTWQQFEAAAHDALMTLLGTKELAIGREDDLFEDVGLDSFQLLAFITEIEARLEVEMPASVERPTLQAYYRSLTARRSTADPSLGGRLQAVVVDDEVVSS